MDTTASTPARTKLVTVRKVVGISFDVVARTMIIDLLLADDSLLGVKITRDDAAALLDAIDARLNALSAFLVSDLVPYDADE